ncbi:hypothetical protein Btru_061206 [Bulinus truncatus]|nr:hypothetical protein Btru_061206 [Bulinus truncatus]
MFIKRNILPFLCVFQLVHSLVFLVDNINCQMIDLFMHSLNNGMANMESLVVLRGCVSLNTEETNWNDTATLLIRRRVSDDIRPVSFCFINISDCTTRTIASPCYCVVNSSEKNVHLFFNFTNLVVYSQAVVQIKVSSIVHQKEFFSGEVELPSISLTPPPKITINGEVLNNDQCYFKVKENSPNVHLQCCDISTSYTAKIMRNGVLVATGQTVVNYTEENPTEANYSFHCFTMHRNEAYELTNCEMLIVAEASQQRNTQDFGEKSDIFMSEAFLIWLSQSALFDSVELLNNVLFIVFMFKPMQAKSFFCVSVKQKWKCIYFLIKWKKNPDNLESKFYKK